MSGGRRLVTDIVGVVAAVALAVTFVACGFAVCALVPQVTETLSHAYGNVSLSPFDADQLAQAAVATRDYTVAGHDYDALMNVIADINDEAGTIWAGASASALESAGQVYTLTPDAISHLDDVYNVVVNAYIIAIIVAVLAVICVFATFLTRGKRRGGAVLLGAGITVCAIFAVVGIWAAVDFDVFFSVFHMLFFESGSWTFSENSLLICMYPDAFWMGMGIIWLAVTLVLSILSIVIGARLRRRRHIG